MRNLKISCQPVAINSGYVWPKNGKKNSGKTITISILPKIDKDLSKDIFLKNLEEKIYQELNLIN
tara:strand:+ start:580 stop:774 length:195 start_codon:yes stop_codon:yes gene_type:complete